MTKLEATHQPNFSELEQWHYEEKRGADTEIPFGNWDEAMKKLVLGKTDEIKAASWPFSWIFPDKNIKSETALFFDSEHPRLAYRLGYTYQVVYRYLKCLPVKKHGILISQDEFLSDYSHGTSNAIRIKEFMETFGGTVAAKLEESQNYTTWFKIEVLKQQCIEKDIPPADEYIDVGDDEEEPFMKGLSAAMADLRGTEDLQRNGRRRNWKNFVSVTTKNDPRAKERGDRVKRERPRGLSKFLVALTTDMLWLSLGTVPLGTNPSPIFYGY